MSTSKLDAVYRSILITKFFTKGWGKPENLRRLFEFRKVVSNRDECFKLVERDYPITITKEQNLSDCRLLEGYFLSPLEKLLPGIVPEVAQKAHFQALLPLHWPERGCKPMCLHLAGTGDHPERHLLVGTVHYVQMMLGLSQKVMFFWRRRNLMVKPLLKEAGIGGIILENPFYGLRKPTDQVRSSLHNVSDIFVMGGCLILESLVLFHWCERNGLGPLGVTGLSMGGHMASLAATNWPKPLVLVPCLSWSTASAVFLQGVMSNSINWDLLEDQYLSDGVYREKLSKMVTIVDQAFLAGKKFAQTYTQKVEAGKDAHKPEPIVNIEKKLDITYKESEAKTDSKVIDVTKNVLELNKQIPPKVVKTDKLVQLQRLNEELGRLLKENKISQSLYEKLTSNETFQLQPQDIDDINKLNQDNIKELILKLKIETLRNESTDAQEMVLNLSTSVNLSTNKTPQENEGIHNSTKGTTEAEKQEIQAKPQDEMKLETAVVPKPEIIEAKLEITTTDKQLGKKVRKSWNVSNLTSDFWINLPFLRSSAKKIDITKIHWRDREALQFMRGIMDECTHLSNFSVPYDTSLIIAVCAKHDAYVPRDDVGTLEEIWPGAEVRYVDAGHVSAYILHQSLFRSCIKEAFERSKKKWKDGKHID